MDLQELQRVIDSCSVTVISTSIVILLGLLYYFKGRSNPPGPWGLPYFGCWPFLKDATVHRQLAALMKKYGDVYCFNFLGQLYIHLGSIKAIKEAHVTKSDCFAQRQTNFSVLNAIFEKGAAMTNGEAWKVLRKFTTQSFREYGLTAMKNYMSGPVDDAIASTVDSLRAEGGKPVNLIPTLTIRCTAILRRMMFNDDGISDEELKEVVEAYEKMFPVFAGTKMLLTGQFARMVICPLDSSYRTAMRNLKTIRAVLKKVFRRHEAKFNPGSVKDLIDSYIKERNDRRSKNDPTAQYFTEDALVGSLVQFIGDGISSVAIFIGIFINALLDHPEEQEKIYKEIEDVIGHNRQATLEDKNKLTYTNAFTQEVQRLMEFVLLFPSLECTKETTVNGCKIPKGAVTVMNVWSSNRDPNVFEKPHEFNPSRYMAGPGKQKAELPTMFGVGKRSCVGESFVMMQVFLFLVALVQNFRLERPEGPEKNFLLDGILEVRAFPRKQ